MLCSKYCGVRTACNTLEVHCSLRKRSLAKKGAGSVKCKGSGERPTGQRARLECRTRKPMETGAKREALVNVFQNSRQHHSLVQWFGMGPPSP